MKAIRIELEAEELEALLQNISDLIGQCERNGGEVNSDAALEGRALCAQYERFGF